MPKSGPSITTRSFSEGKDLDQPNPDSNDTRLPLPAPEERSTTLDMSSGEATVKMDGMGPLVVNQDGSLSRIENWAQMTEFEQKNTMRVIGKRNQARREALGMKDDDGARKA